MMRSRDAPGTTFNAIRTPLPSLVSFTVTCASFGSFRYLCPTMTLEYDAPQPGVRPGVLNWFTAYAILMALVYGAFAVLGIVLLVMPATAAQMSQEDRIVAMIQGVVFLALGLVLGGVFAAALFLPRKPWVWVYDLVLICLGLTSVCCMPATIPLLIFWIKPEVKAWYGRM
jgi:MFS family permease